MGVGEAGREKGDKASIGDIGVWGFGCKQVLAKLYDEDRDSTQMMEVTELVGM
jgi:hypothetical protein